VALAAVAATWCKTGIGAMAGGSAARRALKLEIKKRPDDELDLVADAIRSFGELAGEDGLKVLDAMAEFGKAQDAHYEAETYLWTTEEAIKGLSVKNAKAEKLQGLDEDDAAYFLEQQVGGAEAPEEEKITGIVAPRPFSSNPTRWSGNGCFSARCSMRRLGRCR